MQHKALLICSSLSLALILQTGCGDSGPRIEGPFVEVIGSQYKLFSISDNELTVVCKNKTGLGELEFEAATSNGKELGKFFKFTLKEYTSAKTYNLVHSPTSLAFSLKVGFEDPEATSGTDKGYRYEYFQHYRSDINKAYPSKCTLDIKSEETKTGTRFHGTIDCIMLWAANDSKDNTSGALNAFVDLFAAFDCES